MADNDNEHENGSKEPDSAGSTPNSSGQAASHSKTTKDRSCPFCGQAFTSSSLGRHLDLYIKPRNPKPPDGVHDVDEILKLRGNITRRQTRVGAKPGANKDDSAKKESNGVSKQAASNSTRTDSRITDDSPTDSPAHAKENSMQTFFNAPNWQTTGVINNLPARSPSRTQSANFSSQAQRVQEMRRDTAGNRIARPEYGADTEETWKLQEAAELGRAAEMALREVLASLEAAKRKVEPRQLFDDVNLASLNFPGMCLALLDPPTALFSTTPFPAAHTWPLEPPGERQLDRLMRVLNERRLEAMRNGLGEAVLDSAMFKYHAQLGAAADHWKSLSQHEQLASWNLEMARAFVREKDKKQELQTQLDAAQQRIKHLEIEFDRLCRSQLPREFLLSPPSTLSVSTPVMREVNCFVPIPGESNSDYDADVLLDKWRKNVKATARTHRSTPMQSQHINTNKNQLTADMIMTGSIFGVNGAMPRGMDRFGHTEDQTVTYETPRNPGTVLDAEDDGVEEVDARRELDDRGAAVDSGGHGALTKFRIENLLQVPDCPQMNVNGKRPLDQATSHGRRSAPKLYREDGK